MAQQKASVIPLRPIEMDARVSAAAAGDRAAAQMLLSELLPRVRNLIRYLIRSDDVDDIAQQVLLELLRSFKSYRGSGSLQAWSDRITVRVTLRNRKDAAREREQRSAAAADLYAVSSGAQPDDYLKRRDMVRWLDAIPTDQREALVLHHAVGMSVPEIADELGIPNETVRSRLRLAMAKLRGTEGSGVRSEGGRVP